MYFTSTAHRFSVSLLVLFISLYISLYHKKILPWPSPPPPVSLLLLLSTFSLKGGSWALPPTDPPRTLPCPPFGYMALTLHMEKSLLSPCHKSDGLISVFISLYLPEALVPVGQFTFLEAFSFLASVTYLGSILSLTVLYNSLYNNYLIS